VTDSEAAKHTREVSISESGLGPYGQIVVAGRHVLGADEREAMGGHDTGADPFELVMGGLGACTLMTLRMYANRKDWPAGRMAVTITHSRDPATRRDRFRRVIALTGDLDATQRTRMLEIAGHCPVHRMLAGGADIETVAE